MLSQFAAAPCLQANGNIFLSGVYDCVSLHWSFSLLRNHFPSAIIPISSTVGIM